MKLIPFVSALACVPLAAFVSGCSSSPKRVEAGGARALTTMGADVQDFKVISSQLVQSLLNSSALDKGPGRKPRVFVSRIINDTPENFDTDQITFKITTDLLNSGKVVISATDPAAIDVNKRKELLQDAKTKGTWPDFTLHGKILFKSARDGNKHEGTYTFQFVVADTESSANVWQAEKDFAKQGSRPGVGF